jgi:hypothetical protein
MMRLLVLPLVIATLAAASVTARAETYPVQGIYTYENASEKGPAKTCGRRHMQFDGNLRHDTGSGAPEYKNISARVSGQDTWTVIDEFFTGMMRGRVTYTLHIVDPDHIKLSFEKGGSSPLLRRCG